MSPLAAMLMAVLIGSLAQICFKTGTQGMKISLDSSLFRIFLSPYLLAGFFCYGVSTIFFLKALSVKPLSWAYPMIALTYPIVLFLSMVIFKESVTLPRWLGVALILLGVALIGRK